MTKLLLIILIAATLYTGSNCAIATQEDDDFNYGLISQDI